jgi:hypothetical protein
MVSADEDFLLGSGEKNGGKEQRHEESGEHGPYRNDPSHSAPSSGNGSTWGLPVFNAQNCRVLILLDEI